MLLGPKKYNPAESVNASLSLKMHLRRNLLIFLGRVLGRITFLMENMLEPESFLQFDPTINSLLPFLEYNQCTKTRDSEQVSF